MKMQEKNANFRVFFMIFLKLRMILNIEVFASIPFVIHVYM